MKSISPGNGFIKADQISIAVEKMRKSDIIKNDDANGENNTGKWQTFFLTYQDRMSETVFRLFEIRTLAIFPR